MEKAELEALLAKVCKETGTPYDVLHAIVSVESNWDPWVVRFEMSTSRFNDPKTFAKLAKISQDTERQLQMFSWGMGQIMGATARDLGWNQCLTKLLDPENNLRLMSAYYLKFCAKYANTDLQIASYNAGSPVYALGHVLVNQAYVDKVHQAMGVV